jgi:starch synthase
VGVKFLRILMIASEAQSFAKTGGLADVVTALAQALGRLGHHVTLFTPRYRGVAAGDRRERLRVFIANQWIEGTVYAEPLGANADAMLLDCPALFDRAGIYAENNTDYVDNPLRFAFLTRAALEWAGQQPQPFTVYHGHDWQTGLLPVYAGKRVPTVFTIHNLAFQGVFDKRWVAALGLRWEDFTMSGFEFWDRISFLKAGVVFSDALTTVSPTYAAEIQRPEYGYGFDGIMRARAGALVGILNGIDTDQWDPSRSPLLPAPFDRTNLDGKRVAKRALLDLYGLRVDEDALRRPIVAMVSRMTEQKGLDLVAALASRLPSLDATFIIAGTGDARFEIMWRGLSAAHPNRIGVFVGFDEQHAQLVEAGADMFMMPSRYEPCGLNQMYSMRYGTVPIVRAVGGLADTVKPYNRANGQGTGFLFSEYQPAALWDALQRALSLYATQPRQWRRLQINGMKKDFSWERSATEYVKLYKRATAARRAPARFRSATASTRQ